MDLTFKTNEGIFNYRACAIMMNCGKLLAMKNELSPYYFLPGGRVNLHERAEDAVLRELREELGISAKIIRPLWFNQSFFVEDTTNDHFHELCVYFLIDFSDTNILESGDVFTIQEGHHTNCFEWIPFEKLKESYIYPNFIKTRVYSLPEKPEFLTEVRDEIV